MEADINKAVAYSSTPEIKNKLGNFLRKVLEIVSNLTHHMRPLLCTLRINDINKNIFYKKRGNNLFRVLSMIYIIIKFNLTAAKLISTKNMVVPIQNKVFSIFSK